MVGDEPRIAWCPDGAIWCVDPEAAAVLRLEDAIARARGLVLPRMVGGRDLHTHRPDRELLADVVTVRRQALFFHQRSHVLRRVYRTHHPCTLPTVETF